MKDKISKSPRRQAKPIASKNQGEGDKKSARHFNSAEREFVNSARGRDAIARAGDVAAKDQQQLARAERAGKARSKGEDPAVRRRSS